MLPAVGYFKSIICPFLETESCERPYCQFRHDLPPNRITPATTNFTQKNSISQFLPGPSSQVAVSETSDDSKSSAIEQIISEAVKKLLRENEQLLENVDAAKIMEFVGQQTLVQKVVENLSPLQKMVNQHQNSVTSQSKTKAHKIYSIPVGTPAYTPTPLAVLKKSKPTASKTESYVPSTFSKPSISVSYEPTSKVSAKKEETYTPSINSTTAPTLVDYTPSSRDSDNIIYDQYTPPSSTNCNYDYQPTNRELSSTEPSYSPSCTTKPVSCVIDYSPSNISTLPGSEPTYSPAENGTTNKIEYTPSSCNRTAVKEISSPLSPEKYLAMLEVGKEEKNDTVQDRNKRSSTDKRASSSSSSSKHKHKDEDKNRMSKSDKDSKSRHRDKKDKRDQDDRKRKEKHKEKRADKERESKSTKTVAPAPPSRPSLPKPPPKLSPSMVMIDRFKKLQAAAAASKPSSFQSSMPASSSSSSSDKKRIAHVPNVAGLLTSKPRFPLPSGSNAGSKPAPTLNPSTSGNKSAINRPTALSTPAIPRKTSLPRPTITVEFGCRVPANVRQRYLNIFVDEMLKIYDRDEDAFERAVAEEKQCYSRSSNKTVYLNVVVNNVNRIRREAESGGLKPSPAESTPSSGSGERKMVSHSAVLAGKGGASVSWSIEKPRSLKSIDSSLLSGASLYKLLERYILTMEQQEFNGYPRPDPSEKGRALISSANKFRAKPNVNLNPDQRLCDRCGTVYRVNAKGLAIKSDDQCSYHWGRPFQRRGEKRYSCCQSDSTTDGCCIAKWHVSDTLSPENMRGFVATMSKLPPADGNYGVYALDCEMCYTTEGPELTRVTVVGSDHQTVYETLVKPDNPILDHNTRFSGITEEDLENVRTTIRDVQAVLLSRFSDKTILIGHSFDSDLRALRMIHNTVIDTSVVFPHSRGPPYKKALRTLCGELLQKIIQNDVGGHDSAEDAIACLDLMLWKIKQDLKLLK
nr:EOG090X01LQ [Sida crystallina]